MLFWEAKMSKKMNNKRKDWRKKRKRNKSNWIRNCQTMTPKTEAKAQFISEMRNPTTVGKTKYIQVWKFTTLQEEDPIFNSADLMLIILSSSYSYQSYINTSFNVQFIKLFLSWMGINLFVSISLFHVIK